MTYYESEIKRMRDIVFPNQAQLDTLIGIRNYIDNHYDTDVNLDVLSHKHFLSKFHLIRLFRRYYGQTPGQYLMDKRIEKSKTCLRKGWSISETCFAIGLASPCSFSTLFKSRTGLTPTEFQKRAIFTTPLCS